MLPLLVEEAVAAEEELEAELDEVAGAEDEDSW